MEKIKKFFTKNLEDIVSLDLRALGFFRIFIGSILLIDMLDRMKDPAIFYTEGGVGVTAAQTNLLTNVSFSLNNLFPTDPNFQLLIFAIGAILAFLLIAGFKTRIVTILMWIVLVSVQNRNFLIIQGGDDYIRVLLFWGIFLPIGYRFSYDFFRNKTKYLKLDNKFVSPINIGVIFQIIYLYYFSAISKSSPIWNKDFTAIYYSLSLDGFVTWLGRILLTIKPLLVPLTAFVYYLELYVTVLFVSPFWNWITRAVGVILIIGLHLGIGTTLDVGVFPWIAICGVLILMPTEAIDFALRKINKNKRIQNLISKIDFEKLKKFQPKEKVYKENRIYKKYPNFFIVIETVFISLFAFSVTFSAYIWNTGNNGSKVVLPEPVKQVFLFTRMDQQWSMFAPFPFTDDGWYVIIGKLENGNEISMFGSSEKTNFNGFPANYSQNFKNERWRKLMANLYYEQYSFRRTELLNYMCREWNTDSKNTVKLESIEMYYMLERTLPDFQTAPIEKLDFGERDCY